MLLPAVAILLALAYAVAHLPLAPRWTPRKHSLLPLIGLTLLLRFAFLALLPTPGDGDVRFDAQSFRMVGELLRAGQDVYAATDRYPYLPLHMYLFALSSLFDDWFGPSFFAWVRLPNVLADVGILIVIYRGSLRLGRSRSTAFWLSFLWAIQPISIFHSVLHGQFHSTALFLVLLAWYVLRFWPDWRGSVLGGLALGLAIADHTWPILVVPPLLLAASGWRARGLSLAMTAVAPAALFFIYDLAVGTSLDLIRTRVFEHDPTPFRFGYSYAFHTYLSGLTPESWLPFAFEHQREILFGTLAVVAIAVLPRRDPLAASIALIAASYSSAISVGSQQLLWIVPFALLTGRLTMLGIYSAVTIPALIVYYWGTCGLVCPGRLSGQIEWWSLQWAYPVVVVWLLWEVGAAMSAREQAARASSAVQRWLRQYRRTLVLDVPTLRLRSAGVALAGAGIIATVTLSAIALALGGGHAPAKEATPVSLPPSVERDAQRLRDLTRLANALDAYRQQHGHVPDTGGVAEIETICVSETDAGCPLRTVLPSIPQDPLGAPATNGYWYGSDGDSFALYSLREMEEPLFGVTCSLTPRSLAERGDLYCITRFAATATP